MTSASTYTYGIDYNPVMGVVTRARGRKKVVQGFLSVDPLSPMYPMLTPYQFASNTPIQAIDLDGLEAWKAIYDVSEGGDPVMQLVFDEDLEPIGGVYEEYHYLDKEGVQVGGRTSQVSYSAYPDQFPNEGQYSRADGKREIEPMIQMRGLFGEVTSNVFGKAGAASSFQGSVGIGGEFGRLELNSSGSNVELGDRVNNLKVGANGTYKGWGLGYRQNIQLGSYDLVGDGEITTYQNYMGVQINSTTNTTTGETSSFIGFRDKRALILGYEVKVGVEYNQQPNLTRYEKIEKDALENKQE